MTEGASRSLLSSGSLRSGEVGLLAEQRGLHAVRDARRQVVRPQRDGGGADADSAGRRCGSASKKGDGFCFGHVAMLVHLPAAPQVHLSAQLLKYA